MRIGRSEKRRNEQHAPSQSEMKNGRAMERVTEKRSSF